MRVRIATAWFLSTFPLFWTLCRATKYELRSVGSWPSKPAPLSVHAVKSVLQCAHICSSNSACTSFVTNCTTTLTSEAFECRLFSGTEIQVLSDEGHLCLGLQENSPVDVETLVVQLVAPSADPTDITPAVVATTVAVAEEEATAVAVAEVAATAATIQPSVVIDIVFGVRDLCYFGSGEDILVLTDIGVYLYDTDMRAQSPCSGPRTMRDVFPGYADLPDITEVKAILLYQSSILEMYTADDVYRWQVSGGETSPLLRNNYPVQDIAYYLELNSPETKSYNWACYRSYNSWERHFAYDDDLLRVITNDMNEVYGQNDQVPGMNGYDLNPWAGIPSDTVALTGYGPQYSTEFLLVDSRLNVYRYTLTYAGMTLSHSTLVQGGAMIFS